VVNPTKMLRVLRGALSRPQFPIDENDLWKAARERRNPAGEIVQLDAEKLREGLQKADPGLPLAWKQSRYDNINDVLNGIKNSTTTPGYIDRYPEVGFRGEDATGPVVRSDGGHRISVAADRNMSIPVTTETPKEAARLRLLYGLGMEDNYAEGGEVTPTLAGINPARAIKVMSALTKKLMGVADVHGAENAERLVRAQDEGADLSIYSKPALINAAAPQNRITNIHPGSYQDFSRQISADMRSENPYRNALHAMDGMSLDDVLGYYAHVAKQGKWREVPWLGIGNTGPGVFHQGTPPITTQGQYPIVTGQEGRHRMMTMDEVLDQDKSLVSIRPYKIVPASEDKYERGKLLQQQLELEGSGRVVPENLSRRDLTEDTLPRLPQTWAEGGQVDDSGGPEGKGALTLAGINPLKFINFAKRVILPAVQEKAVEKVVAHADKTGNEGLIVGRYGDDVAKPYTSRLIPGEKGSVRIPKSAKNNLWSTAPGQTYSAHPHPGHDGPEGYVGWSAMPSLADIAATYAPQGLFGLYNKRLPESLIANQDGALLKIGGLHNALDPAMGWQPRSDIARHVTDLWRNENRFGKTLAEYEAHYKAMKDWADAHGVNFNPDVKLFDEKGGIKEIFNPAGQDLAAAPVLNRMGMMGIPVDLHGNFTSDVRVSLEDAMKSWTEYMQSGKAGPALGPVQMNFDFKKGGAVRNYRIGGFGQPDFRGDDDDDSDGQGALTQVGWSDKAAKAMMRRAARALEEEARLNANKAKNADPVYLPPDPKMQTVKDPVRMAYPGIYKSPQQIVEEAKLRYDKGDEDAMWRLFGVNRGDLDDISQARDHSKLLLVPHAYYPPPGATGSKNSEKVLTQRNANRIVDIAGEALSDPELKLTRSWYEMGPMWERMNQLGTDPAYQSLFNKRVALHSAGASPLNEINRGTAANWLLQQGRGEDYIDLAGVPEAKRASMRNYPADMLQIPGHAYHSTAHSKPLINLEASHQLFSDRHKVPTYAQATDPILADPRRPIADAHLARGTGYSDVRTGGTDQLFKELTTSEYGDFVPWWQKISEQVDEQPRDLQAMIWNALGPQTGVRIIGPGKLEIMSGQMMRAADRLGVSPETARDLVLTGQAGAYAEGGSVEGDFTGYGDYIAKRARRRGVPEEVVDEKRQQELAQPDYWTDMLKRIGKSAVSNAASYGTAMMTPTRPELVSHFDDSISRGLDYVMPTKYSSDEHLPFLASNVLDPTNLAGAKWLPKGIDMAKGALRSMGKRIGLAEGGLPNLGADIIEPEGTKPDIIPGAMDEYGNLPDVGRRTPEPLKFSPVSFEQPKGGGGGGGGIGSLLGPIGAIAGSFIPGVGTALGGAIGSLAGGAMSKMGAAEGGRIPAYAGGGSVDDDMLAYHVMNYDDGGPVRFRPDSELWPGQNPWEALKPGSEEKSLQQGSSGLGGLLGTALGGGGEGGMPMGGLLPMIINAISGGKGGKDTGGFMDIAKFISPVAAIDRGVGLFEEGGRVPGGALRRCSGGRS